MSDRNPYAPPVFVNIHERGILGLDWRKIIVLAVSLPMALAVSVVWQTGPLVVRGALGVFLGALGVALAFGQLEGKTPERWLLDFILYLRRQRFLQHRALRAMPDQRQVQFAALAEPRAATRAKPVTTTSQLKLSFWMLTANAIGLACLTALTIWLAQGGAVDLIRTWNFLIFKSPL